MEHRFFVYIADYKDWEGLFYKFLLVCFEESLYFKFIKCDNLYMVVIIK